MILGINLRSLHVESLDTTIALVLSDSTNKIEVSVLNEKGVESLKQSFVIDYEEPKTKPDLYLVAIGVSEFQDKRMNLRYSVKDGRDLVALYASRQNKFDQIYVDTLFDKNVTKAAVLRIKKRLMQSKVDDEVILFVSGHGLLDDSLDFYYATYNMDFSKPNLRGVSYDALEDLLDGIPARKKLLMMDACHTGEVDKEDVIQGQYRQVVSNEPNILPKGVTETYSRKRADFVDEANVGLSNSFELMQELFVNLSRGSGAVVISAAAGNGYALESPEWKNGVFTYSVINGLKNGAADANGDGVVTVSELRDYVLREVEALTNGKQKPTCRRENLDFDFRVW